MHRVAVRVWDTAGTKEKNDNDVTILVDALVAMVFMCILYIRHGTYIHIHINATGLYLKIIILFSRRDKQKTGRDRGGCRPLSYLEHFNMLRQ